MEPSPPPHPPPPPAAFSGFLPTATLVESLLHISKEVSSMEITNLPLLQTGNISFAVRRTKLMSSMFEEIHGSCSPIPPASILSLTELLSIITKTKELVEEFVSRSALWNLLQTEIVSGQFHRMTREMGRALHILPLRLLDVSADVREQVELLHRQAKRAEVIVDDARECRLREELWRVMGKDEHKINEEYSNAVSTSSGPVDCKVEEIFHSIGLRSWTDCDEEVSRLEAESRKQAGTGGLVAISIINDLISLVQQAKPILFKNNNDDGSEKTREEKEPQNQEVMVLPRSSSYPGSSSSFNIPHEFRCPITLDLMRDPVIVTSGQTYDRASIARWINSGHHICPKSGQKLIHMALIPNYALKSLIHQWCQDHNLPTAPDNSDGDGDKSSGVVHITVTRAGTEAVRMTAEFLVGQLAMGSPDVQRRASYELRLLAKSGMENCRMIAEVGAIPFLVILLHSRDPSTQENAVTALFNLSILDANKALIMAAGGAVDGVVHVLSAGASAEARENAAAAIFTLSAVDDGRAAIGSRAGAIEGLVALLQESSTTAGKRDAVAALFNLAQYGANRVRIVGAGAVRVLVGTLTDARAGVTDDALAVLALLCGCAEGSREIREGKGVVGLLVELVRFGSQKGKESAVTMLLGLCRNGSGEEMGRRLLMNPHSVPSLQGLASVGSPRAKRRAEALLRMLNRYCSQAHRSV